MAGRKNKRRYTVGQPHLTRRRGKARNWSGWIDGQEISLGTADRTDALQRLEDLAEERRRAQKSATPARRTTLAELAFLFLEAGQPPRFTAKTHATYSYRLARFVEWAEGRQAHYNTSVNYTLMTAFTKARTDGGVSAATVNRDVTAIRRMFVFAKREGLIAVNPFDDPVFRELKLREARPDPRATTLSPQQIDDFLGRADEACHAAYAALFRLTAGSGIRIDEARHLDEADVKTEVGVLVITPKPDWPTKSYRCRDVPVSDQTIRAISFFVRTRGEVALDDKSVWKELQRVRAAANLPHFSMHDLRRAWASAVHANGASLKQVSVWLGHRDIATTERYIRLFTDASEGRRFLPR